VTDASTRGRPRSPEAHRAILEATLDLLVEGGFRALSMDAVAALAGVGKATIYRRWRSKNELVAAAIETLSAAIDLADTGSLRGDYLALARQAMGTATTPLSTIVPRLLAEAAGDPDLHAIFLEHLVRPRRRALHTLVRRAEERGEIRAGLDHEVVIDLLAGPIMYRLLLAAIGFRAPRNYAAKIFDQAFAGIAAT